VVKTATNRTDAECLRLALRVTPKGGRDALDGWVRDASGAMLMKARVAASPEDGKANAALISLLAHAFDVPRRAVTITSGAAARIKRVQICGDRQALSARLKQFGDAH
jgi:uncharacterized protein YggU (UPF0235/DUF167 family)